MMKLLQIVMFLRVCLRNLRLGDLSRQDLPLAGSVLRSKMIARRNRAAAGRGLAPHGREER